MSVVLVNESIELTELDSIEIELDMIDRLESGTVD